MKKLFLLAILACFPVCLVQAFEISENTQIVTSVQAADSTFFAARELAEYVFKSSGMKLTVVKGGSTASSQIVIGTLHDVKTLPLMVKKQLAAAGKIKQPGKYDALIKTARGHEDNPSVQAARRALKKRGIAW